MRISAKWLLALLTGVPSAAPARVSFVRDVVPLLTRVGCANSNCHGSVRGKAGFKLSLFGYEPDLDYQAIVNESDGRRVNLKEPAKSLILLKPTFTISHGGGVRFKTGSAEYNTLLEWLSEGARYEKDREPRIVSLQVAPGERILVGAKVTQQLTVGASYSDGTTEDVTGKASYSCDNDTVAEVDKAGLVTASTPGETAVMVRFLGKAVAARIAVVRNPPMRNYPAVPRNNFIDELVFSKLQKLNIIPSPLSSDSEFLRRVYLDTIGVLPGLAETEQFLGSVDPHKRSALIDRLLRRPEFSDIWAMNFNQIFRVGGGTMGKGIRNAHLWIRKSLQENKPYDQFVREMITGQGTLYWDGPAKFYAIGGKEPENYAVNVSQTLLGVRLECARCHNHPFEKWTQDDFYGFAGFFSRVSQKEVYSANEMTVYLKEHGELLHPKTKKPVKPKFLDGLVVEEKPGEDIRERLANWITNPSNPWFAEAAVNRFWKHYMGRGIVEAVDDFRVTNPPSNPTLLNALAQYFIEGKYDFRKLAQAILNSRTYQLSSESNETNRDDRVNYSRYYVKRLGAEQMSDALSAATGVPDKFPGYPPGTKAIMIPAGAPSDLLQVFGRPEAPESICERDLQVDLSQALHLINGETIQAKITAMDGDLHKWLADNFISDEDLTRRIYLSSLCRNPAPEEASRVKALLSANADRRQDIFEDVFWTIFNSNEFIFNH